MHDSEGGMIVTRRARSKGPWTPEEDKIAIRMFKKGVRSPAIAKALDRSPGAVRGRLLLLGYRFADPKVRWTDADDALIAECVARGMTPSQIQAAHFPNRSHQQVEKRVILERQCSVDASESPEAKKIRGHTQELFAKLLAYAEKYGRPVESLAA